jgi:hypothetical protein
MKFMVLWQIHSDKRREVLETFAGMELADYQAESGPDINVLGRWHDMITLTGVAICEASGAEELGRWLMPWQSVCDIEVLPALEDEEAHALAREIVAKT